MRPVTRRTFFKGLAAAGALEFDRLAGVVQGMAMTPSAEHGSYAPGRIQNEYSLYLPGEREALANAPAVVAIDERGVSARLGGASDTLRPGQSIAGWKLLTVAGMNGTPTAVFEKHAAYRGAIAYVTADRGVIALMPKLIGDLSKIRPRQTNTPRVKFTRTPDYTPGPDAPGNYILNSNEDPCYENVAAMGAEYTGWSLVANEDGGPERSLFLDAQGRSRESNDTPQTAWAPDLVDPAFNPAALLPGENPQLYDYVPGYSKRTLLGGYLPAADTGVWNPEYGAGYECIVLLPPGEDAKPMGRVRFTMPSGEREHAEEEGDRYFNATPASFHAALAGIWNRWHDFYETSMPVEIPDEWLLDAARAGITLSRCSYRGLNPTYQIGEGAYTKVPERSHALFPVAHYEFVWAQQLWGLSSEVEPYFQHYLANYILPNGDFLYNTQDQVEAPLNTGVFLWNAARAYDYTGDTAAFAAKLPTLERMLGYVLARYEYSKQNFAADDPHHGLIWGSPEADLGDPRNDYPQSHPYYFQNAVWTWRGVHEYARCLDRIAREHGRQDYAPLSTRYAAVAAQMRGLIEASLDRTLAACSPAMKQSGITPFFPEDTDQKPTKLKSYENHRFMMDWFTADWGNEALDLGHLKHRELAGMQIMGLHTDGAVERTSNFMAHGTLAVKIRQQDYRPFLLTLYALACYAADSGNRYSPEDAYLPGGYPHEGNPYFYSATVNSVLQPTIALRWLLCYEDNNEEVCHLQKAAPKHWFAAGERIRVGKCPTRFGQISWSTEAVADRSWKVTIQLAAAFTGDLAVHIHPPDGKPLRSASQGKLGASTVTFTANELRGKNEIAIDIT